MRLCGHFGPQQYTTISAVLGKFVLRTSLPTLSRGTRREPAMFSPLNHSSVRTFQNWNDRLRPKVAGLPQLRWFLPLFQSMLWEYSCLLLLL